jgi:uncharacterized protein YndB with AHSA1/START domain
MAPGSPSAPTTPLTLRLTRTFPAPCEKVFRAWTDPNALKRWAAPGERTAPVVEVDLRPGGRYRIDMRAPDGSVDRVTGVYRTVDPPHRLVYTWYWETKPEMGETLVTVEFQAQAGATQVTLTHERFPNNEVRDRHEHGWGGCMDKFGALFLSPGQEA